MVPVQQPTPMQPTEAMRITSRFGILAISKTTLSRIPKLKVPQAREVTVMRDHDASSTCAHAACRDSK